MNRMNCEYMNIYYIISTYYMIFFILYFYDKMSILLFYEQR